MSWYTKAIEEKKPQKKTLWIKCRGCGAHIWASEWKQNLSVCPECNYHCSMTAQERINLLFDKDSFHELFENISPVDSLNFNDLKGSYKDKIEANKKKSGILESVVTGHGKIKGFSVVTAIMDFRFLGGSLGSGTGEKILQAANFAYDYGLPYIIFSASGGARMQEGVLSLMQMAKTCAGVARLNKKNIPFISVLLNPTTGGVTASYAMMGDLNISEPGAVIGFAGRRVIEQTIGEKLPDDFQTAEYLLEHGFIDAIVQRKEMRDYLANVLSYYNR
ncbi:MAG: acetyl-CoA carboxylase carboxyltransferase subunit beta [Bacteroidetes bacterium]|nr:MAG: acetyl-CoA carboxylase carboxyltransferase subunit beta [Bacteroidota bacterium]